MIKVLLKLKLIYPYKKSIDTLATFCGLWDCSILYGGTNKADAIISMPLVHFKKIFGENPRVKKYPIPSGMEHFIENVKVENIKTE